MPNFSWFFIERCFRKRFQKYEEEMEATRNYLSQASEIQWVEGAYKRCEQHPLGLNTEHHYEGTSDCCDVPQLLV